MLKVKPKPKTKPTKDASSGAKETKTYSANASNVLIQLTKK